ncbi:MAG: PLP-dependent aspartate aminotransferase family protein [Candidatus Adiutrix sp.]|jgi:cystathionine gamma-synthase|nr:PLP-dependent aspartate aminotransferase family protein [Candidatus Adiutrix sp.]
MNINTICVHGAALDNNPTGALSVPIYQTATFGHPGVGQSTGYDYSRVQNPTREALERQVAELENGSEALAFSSGMAAMTALMELFEPGDVILASDDLYGGTARLFDNISHKNGLTVVQADTSDLTALPGLISPGVRAIFIETPTNPMMKVTDIAAVRKLAGPEPLLIVDNTFLTPYFQRPLELGADVVLHSGTKYLGGHNDTLAGFLVTSQPELAEKLRTIYKTTGSCLAPFDSFLIVRGIKTLGLRMVQSQASALRLAGWLANHPKVTAVHYPGRPDHPHYELSRRQATGFGAMISFEVDSVETAHQTLEKVDLIIYAESLGGVETLITYPMLQTHSDLPEATRESLGITDRLLRLSVGIEDVDDLIADLEQALS